MAAWATWTSKSVRFVYHWIEGRTSGCGPFSCRNFPLRGRYVPVPMAAPPSALFAIGPFMVGRSLTAGAAETSWLVIFKLLVQPAITALIAYGLLNMDPLWSAAAVTLAAPPTGALVFVLAQQYGVYTQRAGDSGDPGVDRAVGGNAVGAVRDSRGEVRAAAKA